jgi:hypothetical protein
VPRPTFGFGSSLRVLPIVDSEVDAVASVDDMNGDLALTPSEDCIAVPHLKSRATF